MCRLLSLGLCRALGFPSIMPPHQEDSGGRGVPLLFSTSKKRGTTSFSWKCLKTSFFLTKSYGDLGTHSWPTNIICLAPPLRPSKFQILLLPLVLWPVRTFEVSPQDLVRHATTQQQHQQQHVEILWSLLVHAIAAKDVEMSWVIDTVFQT